MNPLECFKPAILLRIQWHSAEEFAGVGDTILHLGEALEEQLI